MKKTWIAGAALALVGAVVVACSSSSSPGPAAVADAGVDAASSPGDAAATPDAFVAKDAGGGEAAVDASLGECGANATRQACSECCVTKHTDGAGAYLFFVSECMCVKERCQDACATNFCSPDLKDPDAACNACLSVKNAECAGEVSSKCTADADCAGFDQCMGESGCLKKL